MDALPRTICRSCRTRLSYRTAVSISRNLTSTARRQNIPPESPHFIDVPQPFQPTFFRPGKKKGYLPTPKDIFPRNKPNKATQAAILASTPDRKIPIDLNDPSLSERQKYKARMTELRKANLRSGITELYARKKALTDRVRQRSERKQAESQRLAHQGPREDERLTNNSVPSLMDPTLKQQPPTPQHALAVHNEKAVRVARHEANRAAERVDALHTLYMNARGFITNEAQLLAKIKDEFENKNFGGLASDKPKSYWEGKGVPDGIKQMVDSQYVPTRKGGESTLDVVTAKFKRDQERMKRIAERLSGGKL